MMKTYKIVVIDGQGGKIGRLLIEQLKAAALPVPYEVFAIGTNSIATAAMLKAGADWGATGENPVVVACRDADIVIGPLGIVCADSLLGEVTPEMAVTVGQARAVRILIPFNRCENLVAGVQDNSTTALIQDALEKLEKILN